MARKPFKKPRKQHPKLSPAQIAELLAGGKPLRRWEAAQCLDVSERTLDAMNIPRMHGGPGYVRYAPAVIRAYQKKITEGGG